MKFRLIFLLISVVFALSSCSRNPRSEQVTTLRISHAPHDHHAALYVAAMNPDYFRKNGNVYLKEISYKYKYELISRGRKLADVEIDSSTGGSKLVRRLSEDLADLSFGGVPAILSFMDQGVPLRILLPVNGEGAGLVVAKDNKPVNNWDDFIAYVRGSDVPVKIGYKIATSVQGLIFESALESEGIKHEAYGSDSSGNAQVQLMNLRGPENLIPALKSGLIDGFVVMQPFVAMAELEGVGKTIAQLSELPPAGQWQGNPCCALAGHGEYIQQNPEVVEAMLVLLLRASRLLSAEPEKSAAQVARWLETSEEVELLSLPTITYYTEFNDNWNRGINLWVESMVASGKLKKEVKEAFQSGRFSERVYNYTGYEKAVKNL